MNIIAQNPYRVLGMFANDSLKVMTANIAKIRAYLKVGKTCVFESDYTDVFGPIDRSEEEVEKAISLLSNPIKAKTYKLFWIHRSRFGSIGAIDLNSPSSQADVNNIVVSLYQKNAEETVNCICRVFDCNSNNSNLWDEYRLFDSKDECKEVATQFVDFLLNLNYDYSWDSIYDFTASDGWFWWANNTNFQLENIFITALRSKYRERAKNWILDIIKNDCDGIQHFFGKESKVLWLAQPAIKILDTFKDFNHITPILPVDIQIVYDQFALCLLKFCKIIYENNSFNLISRPVEDLSEFLKCKVTPFIYRDSTRNKVETFVRTLQQAIPRLASNEVSEYAITLQKELADFISQKDEVKFALRLIRNCVPYLVSIKATTGINDSFYKAISTRLADNALYSANIELSAALRKYNNPANDKGAALNYLKYVIKNCGILISDIYQLDIEPEFESSKASPFLGKVTDLMNTYSIGDDECQSDISITTDAEKLADCGEDYYALKNFVLENPNSPLVKEAMSKIWRIEDDEFPNSGTAKDLLAYKQKFPHSHNEQKILAKLDQLLLGNTLGSIFDYHQMIRLWPDHPKKAIIEGRIDLINFRNCCCVGDWEAYLRDFPNGQHRSEARKCIETEKFKECKTLADFNKFILSYPKSEHFEAACARIEEYVYAAAQKSNDYTTYLKQYPNGKFSKEGRAKEEFALSQKAIANHNFSEYYKAYPNGQYTGLIKDAEETYIFKQCKTPQEFKTYLSAYPNGKYSEIARTVICRHRRRKIVVATLVLLAIGLIILLLFLHSNHSKEATPIAERAEIASVEETYNSIGNQTAEEVSYNEHVSESSNSFPSQPAVDYSKNRLSTGARPYKDYYGSAKSGDNEFTFKTASGSDYIVLIKRHSNDAYIDHKYIQGGETATIRVPDGTYDIYFYSGNGWNPNKTIGKCYGGFESDESIQKDGPITMTTTYEENYYYNQTCSYTLYPVYNGNLWLKSSSMSEAFN